MGLLDDAIREHLELKRRRGADAVDISRLESEALGPVARLPDGAPDLSDTFVAPQDEPVAATGAEPDPSSRARAHDDDAAPSEPERPPSSHLWGSGSAAAESPAPPRSAPDTARPAVHEPPSAPSSSDEPPAAPSYEPPSYEPPPAPPAHEPPAARREPDDERWVFDPEPDVEPAAELESEQPSLLKRLRGGRLFGRAESSRPDDEPPPSAPADERADDPPAGFDPPTSSYEPAPPAPLAPAGGEVEDVLEETPDFLEETPEHDRLWFEQRPPRDFDFDDK